MVLTVVDGFIVDLPEATDEIIALVEATVQEAMEAASDKLRAAIPHSLVERTANGVVEVELGDTALHV